MTKLVLATGNIMSGGPSVIRRPGTTKSNTELTSSLRVNFKGVWDSLPAENGNNESTNPQQPPHLKRWTRQEGNTIYIPHKKDVTDNGLAGDRSQYDITIKLFFLPTTELQQHTEHVQEAIQSVLKELDVPSIDLLIVSFSGVTFDADDDVEPDVEDSLEAREQMDLMATTWKDLEELYQKGTVSQLGLAEFGSERLKRFLPRVSVRPTLDQINVRDCCVVPRSLIMYGKQENIELMTHNDSTNILPQGTIRDLLGDGENGARVLCNGSDCALSGEVEPQWVVKYTAVVKDRGVVENKGYFAMAKLVE